MDNFKYSMACSEWNALLEHVDKNEVIAGFVFNDGQYFFNF